MLCCSAASRAWRDGICSVCPRLALSLCIRPASGRDSHMHPAQDASGDARGNAFRAVVSEGVARRGGVSDRLHITITFISFHSLSSSVRGLASAARPSYCFFFFFPFAKLMCTTLCAAVCFSSGITFRTANPVNVKAFMAEPGFIFTFFFVFVFYKLIIKKSKTKNYIREYVALTRVSGPSAGVPVLLPLCFL